MKSARINLIRVFVRSRAKIIQYKFLHTLDHEIRANHRRNIYDVLLVCRCGCVARSKNYENVLEE